MNEDKDSKMRRLGKKKSPVQSTLPPSTTGGFSNSGSGSSASVAKNVTLVRKALNIPHNYEAHLAKQLHTYKHSKAKEMFKQRNMKFTCVELNKDKTCDSSSNTTVCPVDLLQPNELEAIRTYEEREGIKLGSSSIDAARIASSSSSLFESSANIGSIPGFSNPRVPPPAFPSIVPQQPFDQTIQSIKNRPNSSIEQPTNFEKEKEIKQEVDIEEISDDIPSFHSNASANAPACVSSAARPHSDLDFTENEQEKRKLQLLWSMCQEELTVDSELEKKAKRLQEIRKHIETLSKSMKAEEKAEDILKHRKKNIAERRKNLLTNVPMTPDEPQRKAKREQQQ